MNQLCGSSPVEFLTLYSLIKVGVLKYDKRGIASQFHARTLESPRALLCQELTNLRRTCETDVPNESIRSKLCPGGSGTIGTAWDDVEDPWRVPSHLEQFGNGSGAQRRFRRGFTHHRISGSNRSSHLPGHHGDGGVPGCDRSHHSLRLPDGDDAIVFPRRRNRFTVSPLDLTLEPVQKTDAVVYRHQRFRKGFSELQGANRRKIISVRLDQIRPFSHEYLPLSMRHLLVLLEGSMGGFHSFCYIAF